MFEFLQRSIDQGVIFQDYQRAFITKSGLIFNAMVGTYFISIMNTICLCK